MESVQIADQMFEDGSLKCAFYREFSVTKNISGHPVTWDLSRERFNLFYAEGDLKNGRMIKHSFAEHTNQRFHFLSTRGYKSLNGE